VTGRFTFTNPVVRSRSPSGIATGDHRLDPGENGLEVAQAVPQGYRTTNS
jgi:hypothetical protein